MENRKEGDRFGWRCRKCECVKWIDLA